MIIERITIDPRIMGGKPCIKGTRATVGTILGLLSGGRTHDELLDAYPYIKEEDIRAALEYGAWRAEEVELEVKSA